jgi:hypothetical protein
MRNVEISGQAISARWMSKGEGDGFADAIGELLVLFSPNAHCADRQRIVLARSRSRDGLDQAMVDRSGEKFTGARIPAARLILISSDRLRAPILSMIRARWISTVRGLIARS